LVDDYTERYANPYIAAERGYIDDVIDPADTRRLVIAGFDMLRSKREELLPRKHGVIPLYACPPSAPPPGPPTPRWRPSWPPMKRSGPPPFAPRSPRPPLRGGGSAVAGGLRQPRGTGRDRP